MAMRRETASFPDQRPGDGGMGGWGDGRGEGKRGWEKERGKERGKGRGRGGRRGGGSKESEIDEERQ